jgi:eukaryotic-like serine/threonine-protein kinase
VPIGSGVQLIVSNGKVQVPNVVGKTVAQATQILEQAGFQPPLLKPDTSPGTAHVVSQNPASGAFADYGSSVTLQTDAPSPSPSNSPSPPSPSPSTTETFTPPPSQSPTPSSSPS